MTQAVARAVGDSDPTVIADGGRFHALPNAPQWNPAQPRTR
jgi:hypothetical protein